jgi:hypothetical protein
MSTTKIASKLLIMLAAALASSFFAAAPSHAIPSYSRQTGNACSACHFQHYPALNEFGRDFKAGGYTDMGKQVKKIEKEDLSLPEVLNASLFFKLRYQKTNGTEAPGEKTTNSGELQFPDEFSLLFGGRIAKNIGFFLEGQLANHDEPFLANFKMPFMYDVGKSSKVGVIPFTSQDLGAAFGFELLNTGAVHNIRIMEHAGQTSAQQYIGTDTAAEGAAFVYYNPLFHVNLTKWSPNHVAGAQGSANGKPTATYGRAAITPVFKEWDLGFGGQVWSGSANEGDGPGLATVTSVDTKAWALDAQAQGMVGRFPLGIYLTHAVAKGTPVGSTTLNLFNSSPSEKKATALAVELGIVPNKATLMFAYRKGDTPDPMNSAVTIGDNAATVGGTYQIAQNVQLQLQYSKFSGSLYNNPQTEGDQKLTLMLSAGF